MDGATMLSMGLFGMAMAYLTMLGAIVWLLGFSFRSKVFAIILFGSSAATSMGTCISVLLRDTFLGMETLSWSVLFVVAQNTLWFFIVNAVLENRKKLTSSQNQFDRIEGTGVDSNRILTEIEIQDKKRQKQDDKRAAQDLEREQQDDAREEREKNSPSS